MACSCGKTNIARLNKENVKRLADACAKEFEEPYVVYKHDHFYYYMTKAEADKTGLNYLLICNP